MLPRFVSVAGGDRATSSSSPLETVIRLHLPELFPRHGTRRAPRAFQVTRNIDFEIDDDEVEDLLKTIEDEVRKRRRGAAVRLESGRDAPPNSSRS